MRRKTHIDHEWAQETETSVAESQPWQGGLAFTFVSSKKNFLSKSLVNIQNNTVKMKLSIRAHGRQRARQCWRQSLRIFVHGG
jgi:hypothetical protein